MTWTWRQTRRGCSRSARRPWRAAAQAARVRGDARRAARPARTACRSGRPRRRRSASTSSTPAPGYKRADVVKRQIEELGLEATIKQEGERGWIVRFGPVTREDMLTVLNGYVW